MFVQLGADQQPGTHAAAYGGSVPSGNQTPAVTRKTTDEALPTSSNAGDAAGTGMLLLQA